MSITTGTIFRVLQRDGVLKPGLVLDLGCGDGIDAITFSQNNFMVEAVDADASLVNAIPVSASLFPIISKIEDYLIQKDHYNLISCQYALHFLSKNTEKDVIRRMVDGTVPGGVVSFNLLGENDEWKDIWTTWTRSEADDFLKTLPVSIHKTITEEGMGMTRSKTMKYWHVYNYLLIKK